MSTPITSDCGFPRLLWPLREPRLPGPSSTRLFNSFLLPLPARKMYDMLFFHSGKTKLFKRYFPINKWRFESKYCIQCCSTGSTRSRAKLVLFYKEKQECKKKLVRYYHWMLFFYSKGCTANPMFDSYPFGSTIRINILLQKNMIVIIDCLLHINDNFLFTG